MTYTAHVDTFARDHLPPPEQWPDLVFDLPELNYPDRLNCAEELLDRAVARGWGERTAILAPGGLSWTYAELTARANRIAHVLVRGHAARSRKSRPVARTEQPDDGGVLVRGHEGGRRSPWRRCRCCVRRN